MGFLKEFFTADYNLESSSERWKCVERATSERVLQLIFEDSKYSDTRLQALGKIGNKHLLTQICTQSTDLAVKTVAVNGLGESLGLTVWRSPKNKGYGDASNASNSVTVDYDDVEFAMKWSDDFACKCALQMCPDPEIVRRYVKGHRASDEMVMALRETMQDDDALCAMFLEYWYFGNFVVHIECFKDRRDIFDMLLDRAEQVILTKRNWKVFTHYKLALDGLDDSERASRSKFWAEMIRSIEADLARKKGKKLQEHLDLMIRYIKHFIGDADLEELIGTLREDYVIDQIQEYRRKERERLAFFENSKPVIERFKTEWDARITPERIEQMRGSLIFTPSLPSIEPELNRTDRNLQADGDREQDDQPERIIEVDTSNTYALSSADNLHAVLPPITDDLLSDDFKTAEFLRGSYGPGEQIFWDAFESAKRSDTAVAIAQFNDAIGTGLSGALLATAYGNCAQLNIEMGHLFEAVDAFRNCLSVSPKAADTAWEAASRLSYVYEAAGRSTDASALQSIAEKANSELSDPVMHPTEEIMRHGELARQFSDRIRDGQKAPLEWTDS